MKTGPSYSAVMMWDFRFSHDVAEVSVHLGCFEWMVPSVSNAVWAFEIPGTPDKMILHHIPVDLKLARHIVELLMHF